MASPTPDEVADAFQKLDHFLEAAKDAAPSLALLLEVGRAQGIKEQTLYRHLRITAAIAKWALRLAHGATADRAEVVDLAELLAWARR